MSKLYKLRFRNSDFTTKQSTKWYTGVIDLYVNDQYINYSARQSEYGTDLLGDGTYTGANRFDDATSEIGYVSGGRFVDTSGRIDIVSWQGSFTQPAGGDTALRLSVYSTDLDDATPAYQHATPGLVGDWAEKPSLAPGELVLNIGSHRYVYFGIEMDSESAIDPAGEVEVIISVEINPPVVNSWFAGTRRALDKFPEWMAMREYDPINLESTVYVLQDNDGNPILDMQGNPITTGVGKASPDSVGGQFINAVAGEWITDLRAKISYQEFQRYIENVDLSQKAWIWRTSNVPPDVFSVKHLTMQLTYTASISEFYEAPATAHVFFHNPTTNEIYTLQKYPHDTLLINGEPVVQEAYQVWNALDDIGVAVDLFRDQLESNYSYRKRVLDVYKSSPGVSGERFKKAIRRELNLWRYFGQGATFDDFGATPEILTIEDIETATPYFNADGNPKPAFYTLIDRLARQYPMTWGLFRYGEALWDTDGLYHKGFTTIPKQFDATPATLDKYQSGVGDINDLYVFDPDFYQPDQTFDLTITARGRKPTIAPTLTEIPIDVTVVGIAKEATVSYGSQNTKFHLKVAANGITYYSNISLSSVYYGGDPDAISLYNSTPSGTWPPPTNVDNSIGYFDWIGPDDYTSGALQWYNEADNVPLQGQIGLANIDSVSLFAGHKDTTTGSVSNIPATPFYNAKFVSRPNTLGNAAATPNFFTATPPYGFADNDYRIQYKYYDYFAQSDVVEGFRSIPQPISGVINQGDTNKSLVVSVGNFDFPTYDGPTSAAHKIEIQLSEVNGAGAYGAYTKSGMFIPAASIFVNGSNSWVNGVLSLSVSPVAVGGRVTLAFTCTSATGYPENKQVWQSFKNTYTPIANQKINEHGPYRYGQAPQVGNKDNTVKVFRLNYTDFGLTGIDEQITWIGIESVNNNNVLVWTDTNSVIPLDIAATPSTQPPATYPAGALTESISQITGKKVLSPLRVSAKVKNNLNPQWNPYLHHGWFYEDQKEYYLYAEAQTATVGSSQALIELAVNGTPTQAYQGAPISVWAATPYQKDLRQIPNIFGATPPDSFRITETKKGSGFNKLYAGYKNISAITVFDITADAAVSLTSPTSLTNEITTTAPTNRDHEYTVSYKVNDSFYADSTTEPGKTKVYFSATPGTYNNYIITWENSPHLPATPIEIPLNPLYSSMDEGFIYIDQDEKDLSYLELSISPSAIMATPGDFSMVSVYAYDINGNPKPNVKFAINNFAGLTPSVATPQYITDAFGYASFYLDSNNSAVSGRVRVNAKKDNTGGYFLPPGSWSPGQDPATPMMTEVNNSASPDYISAETFVDVSTIPSAKYKISATMDSNQILADGSSATFVFGYVRDTKDTGVPYAVVHWRKGRDIKTVLNDLPQSSSLATPGSTSNAGRVIADAQGRFAIGPFVSQTIPGYWVLSVESTSASPVFTPQFNQVGDITYWYEYLNLTNILDPASLLPYFSTQQATPSYQFPDFFSTPNYPVTVDEQNYMGTPSTATPNWLPPTWYPIARYDQYQLGLMGTGYYNITQATPPFNDQVES